MSEIPLHEQISSYQEQIDILLSRLAQGDEKEREVLEASLKHTQEELVSLEYIADLEAERIASTSRPSPPDPSPSTSDPQPPSRELIIRLSRKKEKQLDSHGRQLYVLQNEFRDMRAEFVALRHLVQTFRLEFEQKLEQALYSPPTAGLPQGGAQYQAALADYTEKTDALHQD